MMAAALARAWAWAKEHKALVVIAAALVAAFLAGRYTARQPSVHQVETAHASADASSQVDTKTATQSEKITITDFDPGRYHVGTPVEALQASSPAEHMPNDFCRPVVVPGEDRIIRTTVIERGPSTTETHAQADQHQEQDHKLELTITPQDHSGWAFQVGFEDVLQARTLRLAARRRLFGPFWVELSGNPRQRSVGVAGSMEF